MASITALDKEIEAIQPSPRLSSEASSQVDDTYEVYKKNQGLEVEAGEAKTVLKKIDTRIVPILFFIYLLQYLDKNGINYASAFGLEEGTNLSGQDYSWLGKSTMNINCGSKLIIQGSIFYFGYLVGQYPSGYLLQRLPIAKFIGTATIGELRQNPTRCSD